MAVLPFLLPHGTIFNMACHAPTPQNAGKGSHSIVAWAHPHSQPAVPVRPAADSFQHKGEGVALNVTLAAAIAAAGVAVFAVCEHLDGLHSSVGCPRGRKHLQCPRGQEGASTGVSRCWIWTNIHRIAPACRACIPFVNTPSAQPYNPTNMVVLCWWCDR